MEQSKGAPDLFACSSEDKTSVVIFAVSSQPKPVAWSFAFAGFAGSVRAMKAEALCDTLNAGQPDVMNHWETPERIKIVELSPSARQITLPALSVTAIECEMN